MSEPIHILVYSDSLTWGIVPGTRRRLPPSHRWPGVLASELRRTGRELTMTEDCLNGRTTAFEDPYKGGRNGLAALPQVIEAQSPLNLVILMLGTNDFQSIHRQSAWHSAQGMAAIIRAIRQAPIEPGMPVPPILVIAPPCLDNPRGPIGPKFHGGEKPSRELPNELRSVCAELECGFFDAGSVTPCSRVDGVHLDEDQHATLGGALVEPVDGLL